MAEGASEQWPHGDFGKRTSSSMTAVSASHPIGFPVPANELLDSILNRGARREAHVARKIVDIGIGVEHVAGLHGQQVLACLATETIFHDFDIAQQVDRIVAADVVDAIGRARKFAWVGGLAPSQFASAVASTVARARSRRPRYRRYR